MSYRHQTSPAETGEVLVLVGAAFAVLGGWLLAMGSTPYYVISGMALIASGTLMVRSRTAGVWCYFCTFVAALIWSVSAVGLNGWMPMPRLLLLALLGIWFYLNIIVGQTSIARPVRLLATLAAIIYALTISGMFSPKVPISVAQHLQHGPLSADHTNSASTVGPGD
jgi:quinoprotein glucose dehydrogenase